MDINNVNTFEAMTEEELMDTEGGNPFTILKTGYNIIKFAWHYKKDIVEGIVDGFFDSDAYGM